MGNAITPPELFGIDPDETWDFTPERAAHLPEEKRPVFTLKAPDAALGDIMGAADDKVAAAARKARPEAAKAIVDLRGIKEEERTPEQSEAFARAMEDFSEAWIAAAEQEDRVSLQRKVFAKCVVSWRNFRGRGGKDLGFPADPSRIVDYFPGALRGELFAAIQAGAVVTDEEKESLK
jgi:hypothetical protein